MSYTTTAAFKKASLDNNKTPNVILDIEGYDYQFAFFRDNKTLIFDDGYNFDEGLFFDTLTPNSSTLPLLSKDGTSDNLTQQLDQDRGTGSTPSMTVALVDLNGQVTDIFGNDELLGVRANVYFSYAGLEHPKDSVRIFSGTIADVNQTAGKWKLKIDNPDKLKDQTLFVPYQDELTAAINDTVTTIPVVDTSSLIFSLGPLTTHIRIDDEIMEVVTINSTSLIVNRGSLSTIAVAHDDETEVTSIYQLQGDPIELALQLMLSSETFGAYYTENVASIGDTNNIIIDVFNAGDEKGITVGDNAKLINSSGIDGIYDITSVDINEGGTTSITINAGITSANFLAGMTIEFYSQYYDLFEGCGMNADEVDVAQHQFVKSTFGGSFPPVNFLLDGEINAKEFIEKELYLPIGAYFLTRKGRASIGYTAASVALSESVNLNSTNIQNPSKITPKRSISKAFYNSVLHKYGYSLLRDKFLNVIISQSEDSINRIRRGRKTLTIEAKGFSGDATTTSFFNDVSTRLLDRYKYAATTITLEPTMGVGATVEVGDSVVFDGRDLNVFDSISGSNDSFQRVMEVINKRFDITRGRISLTLLDTNFGTNDRFGVIGPSSYTDANSTTTRIKIKKSDFTPALDSEFEKWAEFPSETPIKISSPDFTFSETVTLLGVDEADSNFLLISPALSVAPLEDYRIELADYSEADDRTKLLYPSLCYSELITSGISSTQFVVSDATNLFVGDIVQIHNSDYSNFTKDIIIEDVTGTTITVSDIGFTPVNGDRVEGGFSSDGLGKYIYF